MSVLQPRRAAAASLIGTTIEYYDFFIYATAAALVFNKVFFPSFDGLAGTLISLSTFAIAFVVRPIGGIVIGHLGDKLGRRPMLVFTLVSMGAATLLIGLLPGYASIGIAAPILLVLLRIVQGFALGGEFGGAVVLTMEHSDARRRGFFGSWVQTGGPLGLVLANLVFLPIATLPQEEFLTWGWRIPFLLSVVLIVVGYVLRRTIHESPAFTEVKRTGAVDRAPLLTVLRQYPARTLLVAGATLGGGVTFYMMAVFGLSYSTSTLQMPRSTILLIVLVTMVVDCLMIIGFGRLSDRVGRGPVYAGGVAGMLVLAFPWLWLLGTGEPWIVLLGYLMMAVPHAATQGVAGVYLAEVYGATVRYSGLSLGYTIGMIAGSAVAPMIAASLVAAAGIAALGVYMIAMGVLSLVSALVLNRGARRGRRTAGPAEGDPAGPGGTGGSTGSPEPARS
ncbi:MHS family MFS transporter [Pseudonocardia sp. C8]|uniref:MFS transporter n=1 Tax=Pseudonocardia sp. C8 TaxID=2762759 RepID=UPI0016425236|nr:MFS transporter [Pseudonocardia sp. C8]MBC3191099.1 MHS family MFS transporter [Pseudonocardia sp. C8]